MRIHGSCVLIKISALYQKLRIEVYKRQGRSWGACDLVLSSNQLANVRKSLYASCCRFNHLGSKRNKQVANVNLSSVIEDTGYTESQRNHNGQILKSFRTCDLTVVIVVARVVASVAVRVAVAVASVASEVAAVVPVLRSHVRSARSSRSLLFGHLGTGQQDAAGNQQKSGNNSLKIKFHNINFKLLSLNSTELKYLKFLRY